MPREDRATWKSNYFLKIIQLLDNYPKCFIMGADTVGKAMVPTGRNTMMRKATQGHLENSPALEKLLPPLQGNVGFAFTKEYLTEIRDLLLANKVPAAARAGAIGPCEVTVPAQNTGLGPEKISFFQALGITTKISRGTTEILTPAVRGAEGLRAKIVTGWVRPGPPGQLHSEELCLSVFSAGAFLRVSCQRQEARELGGEPSCSWVTGPEPETGPQPISDSLPPSLYAHTPRERTLV
uniref:Large ribosomal subunit protein uL10-like insertion domain-containing protein n=1 Tax=Theropithecus gelada TaxID=9565 RepID=A0A8D2E588_THEGE